MPTFSWRGTASICLNLMECNHSGAGLLHHIGSFLPVGLS